MYVTKESYAETIELLKKVSADNQNLDRLATDSEGVRRREIRIRYNKGVDKYFQFRKYIDSLSNIKNTEPKNRDYYDEMIKLKNAVESGLGIKIDGSGKAREGKRIKIALTAVCRYNFDGCTLQDVADLIETSVSSISLYERQIKSHIGDCEIRRWKNKIEIIYKQIKNK